MFITEKLVCINLYKIITWLITNFSPRAQRSPVRLNEIKLYTLRHHKVQSTLFMYKLDTEIFLYTKFSDPDQIFKYIYNVKN